MAERPAQGAVEGLHGPAALGNGQKLLSADRDFQRCLRDGVPVAAAPLDDDAIPDQVEQRREAPG